MKLSFIIEGYNGHKYLEELLLSIVNHSFILDEIIVTDHCSKDYSISIILKTKNQNPNSVIKQEMNEENLVVNKTFEKGIFLLNGDLIFLSTNMIYGWAIK